MSRRRLAPYALYCKMVKGLNRNFRAYDPRGFLAAVTAHIPDARERLVRYNGWYSSVHGEETLAAP